MKLLFLGCGSVGSKVINQLATRHPELDCTIGDINLAAASALAAELDVKAKAISVDINEPESLALAMADVDLVFNAVGPFYRSAYPVIEAALEAGVDYLDINDDHDVAEALFLKGDYHERALQAGVKLIIGCGSTPGLTNVIARALVDQLDTAKEIHLSTAVPFVPGKLSPSIVDHMMHITAGEVVQFSGGEYRMKQGWTGRKVVEHTAPFKNYPTYYIGHGETVTLPHVFQGLDEVSNRIGFFPEASSTVWGGFIDLGFGQTDTIEGINLSPLQFMMAYLSSEVGSKTFQVEMGDDPYGVVGKVEVVGLRDGARVVSSLEYQLKLSLPGEESRDPTPLCARLAIEAYFRGGVAGQGLLAPEACFDADAFIDAFARESGARIIKSESFSKEVNVG
jgi:saccharopine dehydrogenase-like NADP-dependent oxidoreductase